METQQTRQHFIILLLSNGGKDTEINVSLLLWHPVCSAAELHICQASEGAVGVCQVKKGSEGLS